MQVLYNTMVAALRFKVNENQDAYLYSVGTYRDIDWKNELPCELGADYSVYPSIVKPITDDIKIEKSIDGKPILRIIETKRYIFKVDNRHGTISLPIFQNENNKYLKLDKDKNSVIFQFINYLGRTKVVFFNCDCQKKIIFEVVPKKIDYEDDYIKLTESLAERCSALLLEYTGSTSNIFNVSHENPKTLMEQFIFLRKFCFSENLLGLFEAIKRNPDHLLTEYSELKPNGCSRPSKHFYTHPFSYGRQWKKYKNEDSHCFYAPSKIAVIHKKNSIDTVANKFLKFALERFKSICDNLIDSLGLNGDSTQSECLREALYIQQILSDILCDRFFDEIGKLEIMPQNNQVLQKREGYSQIFFVYSMVDLALQLEWKGKDLIYEGESKNVALLYEYWLFLVLSNIFRKYLNLDVSKISQEDYPHQIRRGVSYPCTSLSPTEC